MDTPPITSLLVPKYEDLTSPVPQLRGATPHTNNWSYVRYSLKYKCLFTHRMFLLWRKQYYSNCKIQLQSHYLITPNLSSQRLRPRRGCYLGFWGLSQPPSNPPGNPVKSTFKICPESPCFAHLYCCHPNLCHPPSPPMLLLFRSPLPPPAYPPHRGQCCPFKCKIISCLSAQSSNGFPFSSGKGSGLHYSWSSSSSLPQLQWPPCGCILHAMPTSVSGPLHWLYPLPDTLLSRYLHG